MHSEATIIGSGPAGLSLAAAMGKAGISVRVVSAARPETPWLPTYGIWLDEVDGLAWLPEAMETLGPVWQTAAAVTDRAEFQLKRSYGLFDNQKLQDVLWQQAAASGAAWQTGRVERVQAGKDFTRLTLAGGEELRTGLVIDATGPQAKLLSRPTSARLAYQAAYGIVAEFEQPPVEPGALSLMDFRAAHLPIDERQQPPTFLYAMDLGQGRYFVEETSLALAPAMPQETLERRLALRLAHHGWKVRRTLHTERVLFPMNLPLPHLQQPVLGFGAAASLVHPASGYQVGNALRRAPVVARAVSRALEQPGMTVQATAQIGWEALWPTGRRLKRALYTFGLERMLGFDTPATQAFFEAFFGLEQRLWAGYLSDSLSLSGILQTMWGVYRRATPSLKRQLMIGR